MTKAEWLVSEIEKQPSGCIIWPWAKGRDGYGRLGVEKSWWAAHRYAWKVTNGPIPTGSSVLHRCDIRLCVNPAHLFLGTHLDNMRDMAAKGRHSKQKKRACKRGHPFTPENTYRWRTSRICRECRRLTKDGLL